MPAAVPLESAKAAGSGPGGQAADLLREPQSPFDGGKVVAEHATDGTKALRLDKGYAAWSGPRTGRATTISRPTCSPRPTGR